MSEYQPYLTRKEWRRRKVKTTIYPFWHREGYFWRLCEPDPTFGTAWLPTADSSHYDLRFDRKSWSLGWRIFK